METRRVSPNEVQVDKLIYTFADSGVANVFESCIASSGDIERCSKEQIALSRRPADPGETMREVEPIRPAENFDRNEGANQGLASDPETRRR